jgi:hypothetical protein
LVFSSLRRYCRSFCSSSPLGCGAASAGSNFRIFATPTPSASISTKLRFTTPKSDGRRNPVYHLRPFQPWLTEFGAPTASKPEFVPATFSSSASQRSTAPLQSTHTRSRIDYGACDPAVDFETASKHLRTFRYIGLYESLQDVANWFARRGASIRLNERYHVTDFKPGLSDLPQSTRTALARKTEADRALYEAAIAINKAQMAAETAGNASFGRGVASDERRCLATASPSDIRRTPASPPWFAHTFRLH